MLRIEIIEKTGGFLDVKPGTNSPFTISAQEIRKIGEKKGTFSKTITLAATKNNGQKLGFLFGIDVINGGFDINKRVNVRLYNRDTEMDGNFFLQLTKIVKKRDRVQGYEVAVKDDVSDFFTKISQAYLEDLDFSDGNHFLTASNVSAAMDYYQGDALFTYHLTANSDNNYQLKQFKPAFFALDIWDRIHARAGKSYEWSDKDDNSTRFSNWIIPSNTDPISGTEQQALIRAVRSSWDFTKTGTGKPAAITAEAFTVDTEVLDVAGNYNPVTGVYNSPVNIPAGTSVLFNLKFHYKLEIVNNEAETVTLVQTGSGLPQLEFFPKITALKNGTLAASANINAGAQIYSVGATIPAASSVIVCNAQTSVSLSVSNFLTSDNITLAQRLGDNYGNKRWQKSGAVNASVSHKITITGIELEILPNAGNGYGYGQYIELNKFIPKKVKQSDFVAAIMTLNNLIVDEKLSTDTKIVYKKRDQYYDEGEVKKWKLDRSRDYEITFLNEQSAKRQILTYKQDKDEANTGYQNNVGEIYGQVEYTFKSEFSRGVDTTEIVFSPTPLAGTTFGAVVPLFSGINPGTNIRLLYKGERLTCAPFKITEYSGSVLNITNGYVFAGHFDDPIQPNLDLNFSVCDFYFYPWLQRKTNNNMFSLNWRRHFSQIDNGKMLTGWFYLNEIDVKNLKLNDKIFVLGQYWNINKVIDFNPNAGTKLTKCELISVEDLAKIKTRTRFPFIAGGGGAIVNPIRGIIKKVEDQLNSLPEFSQIIALGKNIVVSPDVKSAVVVGDDVEVSEPGVYTPKIVFPDGTEITSTADLPSENIYNTDGALDENRNFDLSTFILKLFNGAFQVMSSMGLNIIPDAIVPAWLTIQSTDTKRPLLVDSTGSANAATFQANTGYAVAASGSGSAVVYGAHNSSGIGVQAYSPDGSAIYGSSINGTGGQIYSTNNTALIVGSTNGYGALLGGATYGAIGVAGQFGLYGYPNAAGGWGALAFKHVGAGALNSVGGTLIETTQTASISASAELEVKSTSKGSIASPKMTTAQKNAISSPVSGLSVFDTDYNRPEYFDGSKFRGESITLFVQAAQHTPTVSTTMYIGDKSLQPAANDVSRRVYVSGKRILKGVDFNARGNTAGSNEAWAFYVRVNDTTDYLISSLSISNQTRRWVNMSMDIALNDGDFFTLKSTTPPWGTVPTGVSYSGNVFFA